MRATLIAELAVAIATAGCYCSHVRVDVPIDAGPEDAGRDVEFPRDAPDAPVVPDCVVACDPVERVATLFAPPAPVSGLSAATAHDGRLGVALAEFSGAMTYTVATFDLSTGATAGPQARPGPPWHEPSLTVRGLGAIGDQFLVTALWTDGFASRAAVRGTIEVAAFGSDALMSAPPVQLGELPFEYSRCACQLEASIFGRDSFWAIAAVDGEELWLSRVETSPAPRLVGSTLLHRFVGAPPRTTPVSGGILPDGRAVIVGGGVGWGTEPREAFLVIERAAGEPLVTTLPGTATDPPPSLVVTSAGLSVFRYVADRDDAGDSRIHAELRDETGAVLDELDLRPDFGLEPTATATFGGTVGGGLVWVGPDSGLRVLPPAGSGSASSWRECSALAVPSVATFDPPLEPSIYGNRSLVAVGTADGADELYVVAYTHRPFDPVASIDVLRVPRCRLDRRP